MKSIKHYKEKGTCKKHNIPYVIGYFDCYYCKKCKEEFIKEKEKEEFNFKKNNTVCYIYSDIDEEILIEGIHIHRGRLICDFGEIAGCISPLHIGHANTFQKIPAGKYLKFSEKNNEYVEISDIPTKMLSI